MQPNFQDTQPAALQQLSGNSLDEFAVTQPTALQALLRQLIDHNVRVHLSAGMTTPNSLRSRPPEGSSGRLGAARRVLGGAAYTTTVWTVDSQQNRLSLAADAGQPGVRALVDAGEATVVAYLENVKVQFDLQYLVLVHGSNNSALQAALPGVVYRFQRRDSFRVRAPATGSPTVTLRHPAAPDKPMALRVLDVSVGGCALALPTNAPPLAPGTRLEVVQVELDADARFSTSLTLQHIGAGMESTPGAVRLGCAFGRLDGAAQRALQHYIDQTQKRKRLFTLS